MSDKQQNLYAYGHLSSDNLPHQHHATTFLNKNL